MRRTRNILMCEMAGFLLVALLIIVLFETGMVEPGGWFDCGNAVFISAFVMEMITISFIPLALYLFKIRRIARYLTADPAAAPSRLLWLGTLRMMMLCVPLILDTLFYYQFGLDVSFGYMAIILFLCLFMIYPSLGRCLYETTDNTQKP